MVQCWNIFIFLPRRHRIPCSLLSCVHYWKRVRDTKCERSCPSVRLFVSTQGHRSRLRLRLTLESRARVQGSGLGPASYVVTAADLHPCTTGNCIFKYADDTYLVVPAANASTRCQEIEQIGVWAAENNLKLNSGKTEEMVIRGRGKRGKSANLPAPCPGI